MDKNIQKFEKLIADVKRDGFDTDALLKYVRKSDFYTAPASTKFHLSCEGGLLQHSLNVYDCLAKKKKDGFWKDILKDVSDESIVIVALLHDICKTYFYVQDWKNQKVYSDKGSKRDEKGYFDWESVPYYTVDDKMPLGHGEKSVMILEEFIKLLPVERYAIRWHMGFSEPKENWNMLGAAMDKYPLLLALHEADMEASHILEVEEDEK